MSDNLRSQIIRVAYAQGSGSDLRTRLLRLAMEFSSPEALKEYRDTHDVRETTQLTVKQDSGESPKSETHKMPKMHLKPDRYADGKCKFKGYPEYISKPIREAFGKIKPWTKDSIADMLGMSALTNRGTGYSISTHDTYMEISGPHIEVMSRHFGIDDDGKPFIKNDVIALSDDAPKGLGTKIFSAQVAQAKEHGVSYIKCQAFRDRHRPDWVGYKIWPKLGYDGPIPLAMPPADPNEPVSDAAPMSEKSVADFHKTMAPKIKAAGFKEPYQVSHLYQIEGGQEWWEEHGESFDAKFDLTDGSHSMKILTAYLAEKAKQDNTTPEEWLSKMASEPKKPTDDKHNKKPASPKKDQHENLELDDSDSKALDAVWRRLRK